MKAPTPPILLLQGIKVPSCHGYPTLLLSPRTYQLLSVSLQNQRDATPYGPTRSALTFLHQNLWAQLCMGRS